MTSAPGLICGLLLLCPSLVLPRTAPQAAPRQAARPHSAPPPADVEALVLLARLSDRLAARPFSLAASLTITRPLPPGSGAASAPRELLLRVHHVPPDRWLLVADGPVREKGVRALLADGRIHVWFPRAELLLELPAALGGTRLFSSDFALDDLDLLASAAERCDARILSRTRHEGLRLVTLELRAHAGVGAGSVPDDGSLRLTLVEQNASPRRLEFLDRDGRVLRRLELEGSGSLPERWQARSPDRPDAHSELVVRHLDFAPHFDDTLFTRESLRR